MLILLEFRWVRHHFRAQATVHAAPVDPHDVLWAQRVASRCPSGLAAGEKADEEQVTECDLIMPL